ncbi:hypothetical protein HKX48_001033 [Thoreauomyces humboldtii]|nr:hypothetical protein HKX48_001033 [Thoreauomyces humboldtii]
MLNLTDMLSSHPVTFTPNLTLVFTPERSDVNALRKQLEDSPRSTLNVQKKVKSSSVGKADGSTEVTLTYVSLVVVEEEQDADVLDKINANPCKCQIGGTCICSELPAGKGCGSSRSKRGSSASVSRASSTTLTPSPALAPAILPGFAGYPRPINIGSTNNPSSPLTSSHPAALQGNLRPLLPQLAPAFPYPVAPPFFQTQPGGNLGGHDPEAVQALFALQNGGTSSPIFSTTTPQTAVASRRPAGCCGTARVLIRVRHAGVDPRGVQTSVDVAAPALEQLRRELEAVAEELQRPSTVFRAADADARLGYGSSHNRFRVVADPGNSKRL